MTAPWELVGNAMEAVVEWANQLGLWAVLILTFGDSFGLPSSGEFAVLVWAGLGEYPLLLVIAVAAFGAALGDNCAYWGGRLIGARVIRRVISPEREETARSYIHRHGAKAIIGTRMLAAVRTKVAVLSGAAHYPWGRFLVYDAIGCIIWAVVFGIIGRVVGDAVGVTNVVDQIGVVAIIGVAITAATIAAQRILLPRWERRRALRGD